MPDLTPATRRRALFGLLWLVAVFIALAAFIAWTNRKFPTGWHREDPARAKARELQEENYRENIKPHLPPAGGSGSDP